MFFSSSMTRTRRFVPDVEILEPTLSAYCGQYATAGVSMQATKSAKEIASAKEVWQLQRNSYGIASLGS